MASGRHLGRALEGGQAGFLGRAGEIDLHALAQEEFPAIELVEPDDLAKTF
ncbi:hypothetical protein [Xanthobacter sp.]|uniref:hypothetical protein n=1 Tax=Xanthobacter sp. TaxID=35809 RepID=UPI0025F084D7|nr:hypothetical protein [Xanthobacter sp.]